MYEWEVGGYIANLLDFYSYRLIGKLTAFLQLQEFSQFLQQFKSKVGLALAKAAALRVVLNIDGASILNLRHPQTANGFSAITGIRAPIDVEWNKSSLFAAE